MKWPERRRCEWATYPTPDGEDRGLWVPTLEWRDRLRGWYVWGRVWISDRKTRRGWSQLRAVWAEVAGPDAELPRGEV